MAKPRLDFCECVVRLLAGLCGIDIDGEVRKPAPYNPAVMAAWATSGKAIH